LALVMSSVLKFAGVPGVVHQMAQDGFSGGKLALVAGLELLSGLLFLYPRTRSFGLLLFSAFLGGAICTHVQIGELPKAFGPALLLALAWIGTSLRHAEALWSFQPNRFARTARATDQASWASREA